MLRTFFRRALQFQLGTLLFDETRYPEALQAVDQAAQGADPALAHECRNFPLVVLNLRAPSVLLGLQVGGIIGHKFLGSDRVSMDLARSELRLEKFQGR